MLDKRTSDFGDYVWDAAVRVGRSAPRIVDAILSDVFPVTSEVAEAEGAAKMLRNGCISAVKWVLRRPRGIDAQADYAKLDPSFTPLVNRLRRPSYFVPELDVEVPVAELIDEPLYLDAAYRFMRRKGMECLAEADRLGRLYQAVIGQHRDPPTSPLARMTPPNAPSPQSERSI